MEADEKDLDAVDPHLMKRLEVMVVAWVGGTSSSEAGFLKRVLRTESFFWCSGKGYVLDSAAALELTQDGATNARRQAHEARRALVRRCARRPEAQREGNSRFRERPGISDVRGSGQA